MSNTIPAELKYVDTHEWVQEAADGTVLIGITDYAQGSLGDIVFVELPKVGQVLKVGDTCGVVESVKAASDIYTPLSGEVLEINPALVDTPEILNSDPYGEGWMWKMKLTQPAEVKALLDAAGYAKLVA